MCQRLLHLIPAVPLALVLALALVLCLGVSAPAVAQETTCPSAGDFNPLPLRRVGPEYPYQPHMAGIEGFATVIFDITEEGSVENAAIVDSRPGRIFRQATLDAITQWRYDPLTDETGAPFRVCGKRQRFDFVIDPNNR